MIAQTTALWNTLGRFLASYKLNPWLVAAADRWLSLFVEGSGPNTAQLAAPVMQKQLGFSNCMWHDAR